MTQEEHANGWNEWSRHVLAEITRLDDNQQAANNLLTQIRIDIKLLQFKSGLIGAIGGAIVSGIFMMILRFL